MATGAKVFLKEHRHRTEGVQVGVVHYGWLGLKLVPLITPATFLFGPNQAAPCRCHLSWND